MAYPLRIGRLTVRARPRPSRRQAIINGVWRQL